MRTRKQPTPVDLTALPLDALLNQVEKWGEHFPAAKFGMVSQPLLTELARRLRAGETEKAEQAEQIKGVLVGSRLGPRHVLITGMWPEDWPHGTEIVIRRSAPPIPSRSRPVSDNRTQYHPPNARTHAKRLRRLAELRDELRHLIDDKADGLDVATQIADTEKEILKHERLIGMATASQEEPPRG